MSSSPSVPAAPESETRFVVRTCCPACGCAERTLIADLPLTSPPLLTYLHDFYGADVVRRLPGLASQRYRLARCTRCDTHYQIDAPPPAWLAQFYASIQVPGEEPVPTFVFEQRARELAMVARQLDAARLPRTALDFGAGTGGWARLAQAAGFTVTAMDVATAAFPRLTAAGIHCTLPFATTASDFSLIHVEQVLEHLADPAGTLAQLVERLRAGGIIVAGVPHDPALADKLAAPDWLAPKHDRTSLNAVAPLEHLNAFSPAGLRSLGERFGLTSLEPHGWELRRPGQPAPSLRSQVGTRLRRRLREHYQPAWALTQTVFLQKPHLA
jgi:SAM-dependent methyltransferase